MKELVEELSVLVKEHISEEDIVRIDLNKVILDFINSNDIKEIKTDKQLNDLIDFIKISNDLARTEIW
jgi:hypothetical protein